MFGPDTCYDVAVIGGGLCGFAAARELARKGHRVALIERRPVLGWEITWAFHTELGEPSCAAANWLRERMDAVGGHRDGILDPAIAEIVLDAEAAAVGIEVLLYAQPIAVAQRDGLVTGILLGTKSGEFPVRARAFVDATENAIPWRLAGGEAAPARKPGARQTLFLNHAAEDALTEPLPLGNVEGAADIVARPTLWPGEVAIGFVEPTGKKTPGVFCAKHPEGRSGKRLLESFSPRALLDVLETARTRLPGLAGAVVTAVGNELYPFDNWEVGAQPGVTNLLPAAPWAHSRMLAGAPMTISQRLAIGEDMARGVEAALAGLPEPPADVPLPHSRVAPPAHEADVLVAGGGTGGAFAAIAAARQGAKTVLIEQSSCLGGIGTGGGIHSYYHGVRGGLQDEADRRLAEIAPLFGPAAGFHPEAKKVVLELMAHEAGVEVVYNTTITGAQTEPVPSALPAQRDGAGQPARRLRAVIAAGPEGNATYQAKAFVDATGDGDLAAMAGAQFTFGRASDGLPHAYSLAAGRLGKDGTLLITNFDAGHCDPTDAVDMTRARRRALGHYRRDRYDAKSRLVYIAPILGLRNSRQVVGDYRLTLRDEIAGRQFPDVIAYAYSHFDNHGFDYENESDEAMLWVWLLGNWGRQFGCEIPYRTLLPAGIEGLLIGCRALSMTHDAHNQLRMQRDLQRIGEAAGIAAAMAAAKGATPRALPINELQAALLATGGLGPRESQAGRLCHQPSPEAAEGGTGILPVRGALAPDEALHDASWVPPQVPALPFADRIAQLGTEKTSEATWDLIRRGDEAMALLLDAAKAEKPATRFWASVALAMMGRPEAAPELRAALAERRAEPPEGSKTAPLWKSAAVLLGRVGDREAVGELCKVLEDPAADLDALIAAVRALGRIGDPAAVPAIEALLERPNVPSIREFQVSVAGAQPAREDVRWQLDLAVAEVVAVLGSPRPDLARRYAADERAYVRRLARRVAELGGE